MPARVFCPVHLQRVVSACMYAMAILCLTDRWGPRKTTAYLLLKGIGKPEDSAATWRRSDAFSHANGGGSGAKNGQDGQGRVAGAGGKSAEEQPNAEAKAVHQAGLQLLLERAQEVPALRALLSRARDALSSPPGRASRAGG